jgi:hypothetical protein
MQSKAKIVILSASALLAVASGAYFLSPGAEQSPDTQSDIAAAAPVEEASEMQADADLADAPVGDTAAATATAPSSDKQAAAPAITTAPQPSGKLTKEQLTPPAPKTEDEKLQQAAEREYNRF